MKTSKEIAQWVIDNRYPKNENEKVSDFEMFQELVNSIDELCRFRPDINCGTCKYVSVSDHIEPCYSCYIYSNHALKFK